MSLIAFHALFAVGLAKYFWDKHRSSMIFGVLSALLLPKEVKHELSKAERTGSKTIQLMYTHRDITYEMILPVRSKPMGWVKCIATMSDSTSRDVTEIVLRKSGISKDFYGAKLHAGQVIRGASALNFQDKSGKIILTI